MAYATDRQDVDLALTIFCEVPHTSAQMNRVNAVLYFDPRPLLALTTAAHHPDHAVILAATALTTWYEQGDLEVALDLCDKAEAMEGRPGQRRFAVSWYSKSLRGRPLWPRVLPTRRLGIISSLQMRFEVWFLTLSCRARECRIRSRMVRRDISRSIRP